MVFIAIVIIASYFPQMLNYFTSISTVTITNTALTYVF